ncbi:MAG: hypothetical protein LBD15_01400 [Holosporales bacterium]|jgi:hypothetical protein|nr:hypothetical protein [Holosporales bacterium]
MRSLKKLIDSSTSEVQKIERSIAHNMLNAQKVFSLFCEKSASVERQLKQETRNAKHLVKEMRSLIFKTGCLAEGLVRLKSLCATNEQNAPKEKEERAVIEFPRVAHQSKQNTHETTSSRNAENNHFFLGKNLSKLLKGVR